MHALMHAVIYAVIHALVHALMHALLLLCHIVFGCFYRSLNSTG